MSKPCIICVAITGPVPMKADNPAVPVAIASQIVVNDWAIAAGGHTRTGLGDNVRLDRETLAPSNAALVRRAVELCGKYERPVAGTSKARATLGLRRAAAA